MNKGTLRFRRTDQVSTEGQSVFEVFGLLSVDEATEKTIEPDEQYAVDGTLISSSEDIPKIIPADIPAITINVYLTDSENKLTQGGKSVSDCLAERIEWGV